MTEKLAWLAGIIDGEGTICAAFQLGTIKALNRRGPVPEPSALTHSISGAQPVEAS